MRLHRFASAFVATLFSAVAAFATIDVQKQMLTGNPSSADNASATLSRTNYLISRAQYAMAYNDSTREPNWVAWNLTAGDVGSSGRSNFIVDGPPLYPASFYQVLTTDYSGSGYDRGHLCPSADRTVTASDNQVVFTMSNMMPQTPDNNQGVWASFETYCRTLASAGNEILIISGPGGFAGSTIASGVAIPGFTWKIVVVVPLAGTGDAIDRLLATGAAHIRVIAIKVPNIAGVRSTPWQNFVTSAGQLQSDTGYTFFSDTRLAGAAATLRAKVDGQTASGIPTIGTPPVAQTATVGGSATFTVAASSTTDTSFTYQWLKNDEPITGNATATTASLTLTNVQAADLAIYTVVVTNSVGSVTSSGANLVINGIPPSVTTPPVALTRAAGTTAVFSVTATGSPTLSYQWRKGATDLANGPTITGATSATLIISNVQSADAGSYTVVVTNGVTPSATSAAATLTVTAAAPTISTAPASQSTTVGSLTTLSVVATGTAPFTYQWRKGGSAIADGATGNGSTYSGATSATLTITNTQLADAGSFDVVVANTISPDATSAAATLTVSITAPTTVATWDFTVATPSVVALPSDITGGTVTQNNNNGTTTTLTTTSASTGYTGASGTSNAGAAARVGALDKTAGTGSAFFEVSFTPATANKSVSISALAFGTRSTGTGPQAYSIFSSVDNYTTAIATGAISNNSSWALLTPTLAAPVVGAAGAAVTLRLYGHSGAGSPGASTANWRIDDLKVTLTTAAAAPTAPAIASTTPAAGATGVNGSANIVLTFNQAVTVSNGWFTLSSTRTGPLSATVTVSADSKTFTITPPVSFIDNDTVTVTVLAAKVSDTATLSLRPAADTTLSFTTALALAPTITTPPVATTVNAGANATFTVVAGGTAPFTYQWRKAGVNITGNTSATTATLALTGVQAADAADYDVVISNGTAPDATSTPVALTVTPVAPTISTPPVAASVVFGANATFTVAATGSTPFTYQWRKGGVNLTNGTAANAATIAGATSATLTLTAVTSADAGNYDVIVTNSVSSTTSTAVALTVTLPPPGPQINYTSGTYAQNFDTLPNTGSFTFTGTGPFELSAAVPNGVGASDLAGWSITKNSGSGANVLFKPDTGSSNSGGINSYGASAATDRALGSLGSGTFAGRYGVAFVNNTGQTLTTFTVGYTGEQWRNGGSNTPNKLTFAWATGATTLSIGTYTNVDALSFTAPVASGTATVLDGNVAANRTVIAPVTVTGLTWAPGQTLTLRWTDTDDSGSDDGIAIDDLTFTAAPNIATAPVAQNVISGGSATFTVATSASPVTYQWRRNGVNITGNTSATTATLTLSNVTTQSAGNFDCVLTNIAGSTTTTAVALNVGTRNVAITLANTSATYDGTPKAVTATASPASAPVVVTYAGSSTPPTDAGSYLVSATVTTTELSGSATALLTIAQATQTVTFGTVPATLAPGTAFTLSATASSGLPVTLSVVSGNATVSGNSVTLADTAAVTLRATQAGSTNYSAASAEVTVSAAKLAQSITFAALGDQRTTAAPLTLSATASSGLSVTFSLVSGPAALSGSTLTLSGTAGTVTVRAAQAGNATFNAATAVDRSFAVTVVNTAPVITSQPAAQTALVGASATFAVAATGTPAPTYQWRKDGSNIPNATNAALTLANVTAADAAGYDVVVTNAVSSVTSSLARLTVNATPSAPVITRQPANVVAVVGRSASFSVVATGAPAPTYQWSRVSSTPGAGASALIPGATSATLSLANVTAADAGNYTVTVTNSAGSVTASASLRVIARSYAGTYFGSLGNGGTFALRINEDNTGVFLGFLPGSSTAFVSQGVTVDDSGRFTFTTSSGPSPASSEERPVAAAPNDITFSGSISDSGSVSGSSTGASVLSLSATKSADSGVASSSAGFYQAGAAGTSAQTLAIVSPTGQAIIVTQNGASVDGGTGTVDATGKVTVTTAARSTVSASLSADSAALSATVTTATGASTTFSGFAANSAALAQQRIVNLSTRTTAGIGDQVAIVGFVITGLESKPVLLRAVGPALRTLGVTTALAAPRLDLRSGTGALLASNTAWGSAGNAAEISNAAARSGAFPLAAGSADSVILTTLAPGTYSAVISAADARAGVGLVEIYDLSGGSLAQKLANLSTRAPVGSGEATLISGLVIGGTAPKRVLIRAAGPSLTQFGVAGALARPSLAVFSGNTTLAQNAGWSTSTDAAAIADAAARVGAFAFAATSADAAVIVNLPPGAYTAQVTGVAGATGITVLEVYELP